MDNIKFIDELPPGSSGSKKGEFRLMLEANPGKWAVYPGRASAVYTVASQMGSNGGVFKAAIRAGVPYIMCVKP